MHSAIQEQAFFPLVCIIFVITTYVHKSHTHQVNTY
jgi:hypothetical protein